MTESLHMNIFVPYKKIWFKLIKPINAEWQVQMYLDDSNHVVYTNYETILKFIFNNWLNNFCRI